VHVLDDPDVSRLLRRFLTNRAWRVTSMSESDIRSTASVEVDQRRQPATPALITAMTRFEQRYGGLRYQLLTGNAMEYGLGGDATAHDSEFGQAFTGILDGDWTWPVDVLLDGRTAMGPGEWPYRVIDRSMGQRLEKHALLAEVRGWPHRTVECVTAPDTPPGIHPEGLPPPVPHASGPADLWWTDDSTAVEATLHSWPRHQARWLVRYFAKTVDQLSRIDLASRTAVKQATTPAAWCDLCATRLSPEQTCTSPPAKNADRPIRSRHRWIARPQSVSSSLWPEVSRINWSPTEPDTDLSSVD
jgi:hypothetical protein